MYKKPKKPRNVPLRNHFVRGSHPVTNLDTAGMKMFLSLCYLLNQEQFDLESPLNYTLRSMYAGTGEPYYTLEISKEELAKLLDIRHKDRQEVAVVQTALDLAEKASFVFELPDGSLQYLHPIYSVSYDHTDFVFKIYLPDMFQEILGVKKNFTLVSLSEALRLKKQSAIFLYLYLLSFLHRGKIFKTQITLQNLLRVLQMHEGAYVEERKTKSGKTKKHFKRYAFELKSLDPALKEITQKTQLQVRYSKPKTLLQYMAPYEFAIWSREDFEAVPADVWKPEKQKIKKELEQQPAQQEEYNPFENDVPLASLEETYPVRMPYDNSLNHLLPPEPEPSENQNYDSPFPPNYFGDEGDEENAYDERNDEE